VGRALKCPYPLKDCIIFYADICLDRAFDTFLPKPLHTRRTCRASNTRKICTCGRVHLNRICMYHSRGGALAASFSRLRIASMLAPSLRRSSKEKGLWVAEYPSLSVEYCRGTSALRTGKVSKSRGNGGPIHAFRISWSLFWMSSDTHHDGVRGRRTKSYLRCKS